MVDKVKALFFIPSLGGGGAERVMTEILHHIGRDRIEPVLVLLRQYEHSPYKKDLPGGLKIIVAERTSDNHFDKIKQYAAFMKIVFEEKPHVIISMLTHSNIMSISAKMLFRKRVIIGEHNTLSEVIKTEEGKRMLWFPTATLVRIFYMFADKIIAVSEGVKTDLVKKFSIPSGNVHVINNPIDLKRVLELCNNPAEHIFFREETPLVLSVGRLVPQKGFDILLKAFRRVVGEMDARLMILGEGPERKSLVRLARELAITEKVSFPGFQNNPYKFLSKGHVFALPSRYEGFPMVMLEAMACNIPVVSTDCKSGPREILEDGKCGLLVSPEDPDALSMALLKLLKDKNLRERFSILGKKRAEEFTAKKIARQYEDIIYLSVFSAR